MILLSPEIRFALRANDIARRAHEAKGESKSEKIAHVCEEFGSRSLRARGL